MRWTRVVAVASPGLILAGFGIQHPHYLAPATAHHWWTMHVLLIPVFPLLALALAVLLRGEQGPLAWAARITGYGFATFYTALDVLSGIGAGLVVDTDGHPSQAELRLFAVGDPLGLVGAWMLLISAILTTVVLGLRLREWRGPLASARVIPGGLLLAASGWVFLHSHIFYPLGVAAMTGFAAGSASLALATGWRIDTTPPHASGESGGQDARPHADPRPAGR